jgi:cathepsin F
MQARTVLQHIESRNYDEDDPSPKNIQMFNKVIIILSILAVTILAGNSGRAENAFGSFQDWAVKNEKVFDTMDSFQKKWDCYKNNKVTVDDLNTNNAAESEGIEATFGDTVFSDISAEDFKSNYLNFDSAEVDEATKDLPLINVEVRKSTPSNDTKATTGRHLQGSRDLQTATNQTANGTPKSHDWRKDGKVGVVKQQGTCGSCYTFVTTGLFESLYAIKYGQLYNFAEQQLLDCSANSGCTGGSAMKAITYIYYNGLTTTAQYGKYLGYKKTCTAASETPVAFTQGYTNPGKDEDDIAAYVAKNGPVTAAINAAPLQYYVGGIINLNAAYCDTTVLNHAVLIVGYGTQNGYDYWIVKNSWGPYWGENGYFRVTRGYGVCGINKIVRGAILN